MSSVEEGLISLVNKVWITTFVLGSLTMQLALLLTGGTRKWYSVFRLVAWNAYNSSDYVATTALASLAQAAGPDKAVYALWAPILLLHLGGPDNICAYARADSELWVRHGLTMILQALAAVYVIANCARGEKYVAVSSCLGIVGIIKYAERTLALKRASQEDIIKSAQPIYSYMLGEFMLDDTDMLSRERGDSGSSREGNSLGPVRGRYHYILRGENNWLRNYQNGGSKVTNEGFQSAYVRTRELVTFNDVLCSKELSARSTDGELTSPFLLWCLGYALFKMYKRRLCGLHMYEWREDKTRQLFLGSNDVLKSEEEVLHVIDVELRFLFDSLYAKAAGTAYTKLGVLLRFVTTALLVVSGVFVFKLIDFQDQDRVIFQANRITILLLAAALAIELYQLVRLVSSDWTRVWLVCMYILVGKKQSFYRSFWLVILRQLMDVLGSRQREKYWRHRIGQYSMVGESTEKGIHQYCYSQLKRLLPQYEESREAVSTCERYVLGKVLSFARESSQYNVDEVRSSLSNAAWFEEKYRSETNTRSVIAASFGADPDDEMFYYDLEHLIATWHVATSICELLVPDEALMDYQLSRYLSRYTTYLLKHKAELLPCHADIARQVGAETERDLQKLSWTEAEVHDFVTNNEKEIAENLENGRGVAKQLLEVMPNTQQRWSLIANVWTDLLIHIAASNKLQEHLQQLTVGGELLTHIWVLLGHMGYGQQ